jgi:hypothetical protein
MRFGINDVEQKNLHFTQITRMQQQKHFALKLILMVTHRRIFADAIY